MLRHAGSTADVFVKHSALPGLAFHVSKSRRITYKTMAEDVRTSELVTTHVIATVYRKAILVLDCSAVPRVL